MTHWLKIWPLVFICACEEAFDFQPVSNDELLVVEALLTNERKPQKIQLSRAFQNLNDSPPPVTNATVALHDGTSTYWFNHDPQQPGTYFTDTLQALFGKIYTLVIFHEDSEYYAQATSVFGTPLEPFDVIDLDSGIYEFVYQESEEPSMTEVIVEWESGSEDESEIREAWFYTLNSLDINTIFAPEKEPLRFPAGARIFRRKYSLTDNHQAFIRSFLAEVDWRGGIFDVHAGNVMTNFSEGAVGYFSVSMVRSEEIIFDGK